MWWMMLCVFEIGSRGRLPKGTTLHRTDLFSCSTVSFDLSRVPHAAMKTTQIYSTPYLRWDLAVIL